MVDTQRLRIFIFDSTRLRSNLLFRYMSTHDAFRPIYHPFLMAAMFGPEELAQHLKHSQMRQSELENRGALPGSDATYESDRNQFLENVEEAEKDGKVVLSNEHWFNVFKKDLVIKIIRDEIEEPSGLGKNPTVIPDETFETFTPMILIRHPALAIHSIYRSALVFTKQRPGDEDFELITMNKPIRILFDWYSAHGKQPVVVDTEDILWRTDEMSKNLCARLGIDPAGLSDKWDPTPKEQLDRMNPVVLMLTKDMQDSKGIIRPEEKVSEAGYS